MYGMPKMQVRGTQSNFSAMSMDGRYAENAGTWYPEQLSVPRQFCAGVFSATDQKALHSTIQLQTFCHRSQGQQKNIRKIS
jgi:hypothetical protein